VGYWAKKVRGKRHYFDEVATDPKGEAALDLRLDQKDDLLARISRRKVGRGRKLPVGLANRQTLIHASPIATAKAASEAPPGLEFARPTLHVGEKCGLAGHTLRLRRRPARVWIGMRLLAVWLACWVSCDCGWAGTEIIPPDRRIDWSPGIAGGIPVYAVGINVKDAPYSAKGDGSNGSIIVAGGSGGRDFTSVKGGFERDSTRITVSDAAGLNVGDYVEILEDNVHGTADALKHAEVLQVRRTKAPVHFASSPTAPAGDFPCFWLSTTSTVVSP
jgi:hypothetical protein